MGRFRRSGAARAGRRGRRRSSPQRTAFAGFGASGGSVAVRCSTGDVASTATTAIVNDAASRSSSTASALRRFAAASAVNSSSSCGSTPMPAAHRRPIRRRRTCSMSRQRFSSISISRSESRYFCFQSVISDKGLASRRCFWYRSVSANLERRAPSLRAACHSLHEAAVDC